MIMRKTDKEWSHFFQGLTIGVLLMTVIYFVLMLLR